MDKRTLMQATLNIMILFGITTMLFLYTSGYRLTRTENNAIDLSKTGMISIKSVPNGASVYVNGILMSATDDTIAGIEPGIHDIKILRKGFISWSKDIEVFPELVTDITAVLVAQSPRLEPLTNTGAKAAAVSPTLGKLAFLSKEGENSGIRIISLAESGLSLFKSTPDTVLQDTPRIIYSNSKSLEWSPDEKYLLVESSDDIYYIVDLATSTVETTSTPDTIRKVWADKLTIKRKDFIQRLSIPEEIKILASSSLSIWAPDEKKFLYTVENGEDLEYRVYNMENPIPIGEKAETIVFTTKIADPQPKITWYSDSYHLILTEGDVAVDKRGTISLIRIDGTNKTEIYNNTLFSDQVFSAPSGDKIIILTSFRSGDQTDLYTVSIR